LNDFQHKSCPLTLLQSAQPVIPTDTPRDRRAEEDAAKRLGREFGLTHSDNDDILEYVCSVADLREIHYLWRPILKDPQDDHVLELAVESSAKFLVTNNRRDFMGAEKFGIKVATPNEFLKGIGEGL
jgi:predicted nucleic acid-binding protein